MNITQIIEERGVGAFSIQSLNRDGRELAEILPLLGLFPSAERLERCDLSDAQQILKTILWKDLAYSSEMVSESVAEERAQWLIGLYTDANTNAYTNGNWVNFHTKNSHTWNPMTHSTFDAGVLLVSEYLCTAIWVEDED